MKVSGNRDRAQVHSKLARDEIHRADVARQRDGHISFDAAKHLRRAGAHQNVANARDGSRLKGEITADIANTTEPQAAYGRMMDRLRVQVVAEAMLSNVDHMRPVDAARDLAALQPVVAALTSKGKRGYQDILSNSRRTASTRRKIVGRVAVDRWVDLVPNEAIETWTEGAVELSGTLAALYNNHDKRSGFYLAQVERTAPGAVEAFGDEMVAALIAENHDMVAGKVETMRDAVLSGEPPTGLIQVRDGLGLAKHLGITQSEVTAAHPGRGPTMVGCDRSAIEAEAERSRVRNTYTKRELALLTRIEEVALACGVKRDTAYRWEMEGTLEERAANGGKRVVQSRESHRVSDLFRIYIKKQVGCDVRLRPVTLDEFKAITTQSRATFYREKDAGRLPQVPETFTLAEVEALGQQALDDLLAEVDPQPAPVEEKRPLTERELPF